MSSGKVFSETVLCLLSPFLDVADALTLSFVSRTVKSAVRVINNLNCESINARQASVLRRQFPVIFSMRILRVGDENLREVLAEVSSEIVFYNLGHVNNDFLPFKYSKQLQQLVLRNSVCSTAALEDALHTCENLSSLTLDNILNAETDGLNQLLKALPNLKYLRVSTQFMLENIHAATFCPKLCEIYITNCPAFETVASPSTTGSLKNVRKIELCAVNTTSDQVNLMLMSCPNLCHLSVRRCRRIKKLISIRSTNLEGIDFEGCTNLGELDIDCPSLRHLSLRHCSSLQELRLNADLIRSVDCSLLRKLRRLDLRCLRLDQLTLNGCGSLMPSDAVGVKYSDPTFSLGNDESFWANIVDGICEHCPVLRRESITFCSVVA